MFFPTIILVCVGLVSSHEWMWWYGRNMSTSYNPQQVMMRCREDNGEYYYDTKGCDRSDFDWPGDRTMFAHWQIDDKFYMYGGFNRYTNIIVDTMYEFDIPRRNWTYRASMCSPANKECQPEEAPSSHIPLCTSDKYSRYCFPVARILPQFFEYESHLYVMGGEQEIYNKYFFIMDIVKYNLTYYQWVCDSKKGCDYEDVSDTKPVFNVVGKPGDDSTIPAGRRGGATWVLDSKMYLFGGYGVGPTGRIGYLMDTWEYDMEKRIFSYIPSFEDTVETYKQIHGFSSIGFGDERKCGNMLEKGYTDQPPCFRESSITWVFGGLLFLYGGHAQLNNDDSTYPLYTPVYYNDLYRYDPKKWNTKEAWYYVSGKRVLIQPNYSKFDIDTSGVVKRKFAFGDSSLVWPGGFAGANYVVFDHWVFVFGGIGYGTEYHDRVPSLTDKKGSFHCFSRFDEEDVLKFNTSCTQLNDMWIFDSEILQWKYLGGDLNAQKESAKFWEIYVDQKQWSTRARPFGTAFGAGLSQPNGEMGFFGGGDGKMFNQLTGKGIGDLWFLKFYSCGGIPWIFPNVCSGNGKCIQQNLKCDCFIGFTGDFCEKEGTTTCFGIGKFESSVCNGHGECASEDFCECATKWEGDECRSCPTCTEEELNPPKDGDGKKDIDFVDESEFPYGALFGGVFGGFAFICCLLCCGVIICIFFVCFVLFFCVIFLCCVIVFCGPYGYTILGIFGIHPHDLGIEDCGEDTDFEDYSDEEFEERNKRGFRDTIVGKFVGKVAKGVKRNYDGSYDSEEGEFSEEEGEEEGEGEEGEMQDMNDGKKKKQSIYEDEEKKSSGGEEEEEGEGEGEGKEKDSADDEYSDNDDFLDQYVDRDKRKKKEKKKSESEESEEFDDGSEEEVEEEKKSRSKSRDRKKGKHRHRGRKRDHRNRGGDRDRDRKHERRNKDKRRDGRDGGRRKYRRRRDEDDYRH